MDLSLLFKLSTLKAQVLFSLKFDHVLEKLTVKHTRD
jgi:hypothetical protein